MRLLSYVTLEVQCRPTSVVEQQCEVIEFLQRRCTNLAHALLRAQAQEDRCVCLPVLTPFAHQPGARPAARSGAGGEVCLRLALSPSA